MKIEKTLAGQELTVALQGRLDTVTAPELEQSVKSSLDGIAVLTYDLKGLEYISSAGLRVLLSTQKIMNKQGKMLVKNVAEEIMEVFEVTGFSDMLTII